MRLAPRWAIPLLCSITAMVWAHSALAQPANLNHAAGVFDGQFGDTYKFARQDWERRRTNRKGRDNRAVAGRSNATAMSSYAAAFSSSGSLVAEARRYLGTNPTGWRNRWCGAFMDMVLKRTGHKGGGNLALAYAKYGRRVSGPQIGAIAVMTRRGGGHVGVVSGIDPNGNPVVVSGNHNDIVAEAVYPRSRIIAYVVPY